MVIPPSQSAARPWSNGRVDGRAPGIYLAYVIAQGLASVHIGYRGEDLHRARILRSLMRQLVVYDIECEKHEKRKGRKAKWLNEWSAEVAQTVNLAWAASSLALATGGSYVLAECAKLIAFREEVLIGRYCNFASVEEINAKLNERAIELEVELEAIKRSVPAEERSDEECDDEDNAISPKKMLKVLGRSLKYLKRSNVEISKALDAFKVDVSCSRLLRPEEKSIIKRPV